MRSLLPNNVGYQNFPLKISHKKDLQKCSYVTSRTTGFSSFCPLPQNEMWYTEINKLIKLTDCKSNLDIRNKNNSSQDQLRFSYTQYFHHMYIS